MVKSFSWQPRCSGNQTLFINKAIQINQKYDNSYVNKGVTLKSMGNYNEAMKCYIQAVNINPNNAIAFNNISELLSIFKEFDLAIENIIKDVNKVDIYKLTGVTYF